MTPTAPRRSFRTTLIATTALMSGIAGIAPALAQVTPSNPSVGAGAPVFNLNGADVVGAAVDGSTGTLKVTLNDANTIVNWGAFDVGAVDIVNFDRAAGVTGNIAILNRDLSGTISNIDGTMTSDAGIAIYVLNPTGVIFGAGANVNVGALIAASLGLTDGDFLNGQASLTFTGPTGSTAVVQALSGAKIATTGTDFGQLALIGAQVDTAGDLTASGDVALVAATNVVMTASAGSPLGFTIDAGTSVATPVTVNGTVAGRNVTFTFATLQGVTDAVLSVAGTVTATVATASDKGIVLLAGQNTTGTPAPTVTVTANNDTSGAASIDVDGSLTLASTGGTGDLRVLSSGKIEVAGGLTAATGFVAVDGVGDVFAANVTGTAGATGTSLIQSSGGTTKVGLVSLLGGGLDIGSAGQATSLAGDVTATGDIDLLGPVTLLANVAIAANANGAINFASTVGGAAFDLATTTGGTTSFGGAVTLNKLTVNGAAAIDGGAVTTTDAQAYNGPVTLKANAATALTGSAIAFAGTLGGATSDLTVTGPATFGGAVTLANLTVDGTSAINGGSVATAGGSQIYKDAISLGAATILSGTKLEYTTIAGNGNDLALNFSDATTIGLAISGVRDLSTDAAGDTFVDGNVVTTGAQTYKDAVTLKANAVFESTGDKAITFENKLDGAFAATVNTGGVTSFNGAVGGGTALASLTTDAKGVAGEQTGIGGGAVTTTGAQTYGDAVALKANAATALTGSAIKFAGTLGGATSDLTATGAATFGGAVTLANLTVNGTSAINGGSVATAGGKQTYNDAVTLGAGTTLSGTALAYTTIVGAGNDLALNFSDATAVGPAITGVRDFSTGGDGLTIVNGDLTTSGAQTYDDAVTLAANAVFASTGDKAISFNSTLDGAFAATVNTGGVTTFKGAVGGEAALASLTTDAKGSVGELTLIHGGSVTTTGAQTYGDAVELSADTLIESKANDTVTFAATVDSVFTAKADPNFYGLEVRTAGDTTFAGAVGGQRRLGFLTTNGGGTTKINGGLVATTSLFDAGGTARSGAQTYDDNVLLGAPLTTLRGFSATFATVDGQGNDLTLSFADPVTVGANFINIGNLNVGEETPLCILPFPGPCGGVTLPTDVTTGGDQTYNVPVRVAGDIAVTSTGGGAISFNNTVDSAAGQTKALTVNTSGVTTFGFTVGGSDRLSTLTTDADGETVFGQGFALDIRTTGDQLFKDAVTLKADTTYDTAGALTFEKTVDGGFALIANGAGATSFQGDVGNTTRLASITTDSGGDTIFGPDFTLDTLIDVKTTKDQIFNDAVTLKADTTFDSNNGGAITFGKTVDGAYKLAANTAGATSFLGDVGSAARLISIATDEPGGTVFGPDFAGGGLIDVKTTKDQIFNDAVTLAADAIFDSNDSGAITFGKTVDGGFALGANTAGTTSFVGDVGKTARLTSIATDADGETVFGNGVAIGVNTTGNQIFKDAVTLKADTTFDSNTKGAITFEKTVDGGFKLEANTGGTTTFGGKVGFTTALSALTTDALGETVIAGGFVRTTGDQVYNDRVLLKGDTLIETTASGKVAFAAAVDSESAVHSRLTVQADGKTSFAAAVGGEQALASLTVIGNDAVSVLANVTVDEDYTISALSKAPDTVPAITLGEAAAVTQQAGRTVDIQSKGGDILGQTGLTLASNASATTGNLYPIVLRASAGDISFDGATLIAGGADLRASEVGIYVDAGNDLTLGIVRARGLSSTDVNGVFLDTLTTAGDIVFNGEVRVRNGLTVVTSETITTGANAPIFVTGTRQPLSLTADKGVTAGARLSSQGLLTLASSAGDIAFTTAQSNAGDASLTATKGRITGGTLLAAGSVTSFADTGTKVEFVTSGAAAVDLPDADIDPGNPDVTPSPSPIAGAPLIRLRSGGDLQLRTVDSKDFVELGAGVNAAGDIVRAGRVFGFDTSNGFDPALGRTTVGATGNIDIKAGGLVQLATVTGQDVTINAGIAGFAGGVDATQITSRDLTVTALNDTAAGAAGIRLGTQGSTVAAPDPAALTSTARTVSLTTSGKGDIAIGRTLQATGAATIASAENVLLGTIEAGAALKIDALRSVTGFKQAVADFGPAADALTIGSLTTDASILLSTSGNLRAGTLTSNKGAVELTATGAISGLGAAADPSTGAGTVKATTVAVTAGKVAGDIARLTSVTATTGDASISGFAVAVGAASTPANLTLSDFGGGIYLGTATAGSVTIASSGNGAIDLGSLSNNANNIVDPGFGSANLTAATRVVATSTKSVVQLGTVTAGTDVTATALNGLAIVTAAATNGALTLKATAGPVYVGTASAGTTADVQKLGGVVAAGNELRIGSLTAGKNSNAVGTVTLNSDTDARLGTVVAQGGALTVTAAGSVTGVAGASNATDTAFGRAALASSVNGTATDRTVSVSAGKLIQLGAVAAGEAVTLTAGATTGTGAIDASSVTSARGGLTAIANNNAASGAAGIKLGDAAAGVTQVAQNVTLTASGTRGDMDIGKNVTAGGAITVTGFNVNATGNLTATGPAAITLAGNLSAAGISGSTVGIGAGGITVGSINAGSTATTTGGATSIGTLTAGTDASITSSATVTLGATSAQNLTISSKDAEITGVLALTKQATLKNTGTSTMALGDNANAGGFTLSNVEVGRVNAPDVTFDSVGNAVAIGDVSFGAATVKTSTVLTAGRIDVTGTVSAGTAAGFKLQLGGSGAAAGQASVIRVAATAAGGGGKIIAPNATVELRGGAIGVGQDTDFLAPLGVTSGSPVAGAQAATAFVSNTTSTLYLGRYNAVDPVLINVANLRVSYSNFALFQNTTQVQATGSAGAIVSGTLNTINLDATAPDNAFALFGTVAGQVREAAALVPGINVGSGVSRGNSRINGCLIGASGGGCLIALLPTPSINLFDSSQVSIFATAPDIAITFDPIVGSSNEALFSDLGTADIPGDDECDPAADPTCRREGTNP